MHIEQIGLKNVMTHKVSGIEFPTCGITLITGENGSGKSCLAIESVSAGFWGKTLRKTPVWREKDAGLISIVSDVVLLNRTKNPNESPKLDWSSTKYTTTTKSQEALENIIGDWDRWRRVNVLSSQDISHFTLATDGDRKRLIEGLLGCDRFDPGLKRCRKDLRAIEERSADLDKECSVLRERVIGLQDRVKDLMSQKEDESEEISEEQLEKVKKESERISRHIIQCAQEIKDIKKPILDYKSDLNNTLTNLNLARKESDRFNKDKCPYCDRPITGEMKEKLKDKIKETRIKADYLQKQIKEEEENIKEELEELEEENEELNKQLDKKKELQGELKQKLKDQKEREKNKKQRMKLIAELKSDVLEVNRQSLEKEDEWDEINAELAELKATEKVLGLEGFRAHIIGETLSGIEIIGNKWLELIAKPGMRMELKPYSEKKTGGVKDKISLKIIGAGGGYGYNGASAGERRRIDVALLFALAEIAAEATGVEYGDIFIDEVADGLDAKGRSAVAEVLKEIAGERSVIVITHDETFARLLKPKQHIHLTLDEDGRTEINYLKKAA